MRLRSAFEQSPLGIAGAYFSANTGDTLMGHAVQSAIRLSVSPTARLISHSDIGRYRGLTAIVCGGGELGDEALFSQIFKAVPPERVSILGCSPHCKIHEASADVLKGIKSIPFICTRSKSVQAYLQHVLGRDDIQYAPDIVFGMHDSQSNSQSNRHGCGINIIPFYADILRNGRIVPSSYAKTMLAAIDKEVSDLSEQLPAAYLEVVNSIIDRLIEQHGHVDVIPFSKGDDVYARSAIRGRRGLQFVGYTSNFQRLSERMRSYNLLVATRFHAHILGLMSHTPVHSICYSSKCIGLLRDLDVCPALPITRREVLFMPAEEVAEAVLSQPITLSPSHLADITSRSRESLQSLCRHLRGLGDL